MLDQPIYSTIQANTYDIPALRQLEIRGQEFPLDVKSLRKMVEEKEIHTIVTSCDYEKVGYAMFTIDEDGDIEMVRVTYRPEHAVEGIASLIDVITATPNLKRPKLTTLWPEYDYGHETFKALLAGGLVAVGLESDAIEAYGKSYDAIILELT